MLCNGFTAFIRVKCHQFDLTSENRRAGYESFGVFKMFEMKLELIQSDAALIVCLVKSCLLVAPCSYCNTVISKSGCNGFVDRLNRC